MNNNKKFARAAQFRRVKAVFITLLFHAALFAAVTQGTNGEYEKLLPDFVKEWLDFDNSAIKKDKKEVA